MGGVLRGNNGSSARKTEGGVSAGVAIVVRHHLAVESVDKDAALSALLSDRLILAILKLRDFSLVIGSVYMKTNEGLGEINQGLLHSFRRALALTGYQG